MVDAGLIRSGRCHALEAQHMLDAPLGDYIVAQGLRLRAARWTKAAALHIQIPAGRILTTDPPKATLRAPLQAEGMSTAQGCLPWRTLG